MSAIDGTLSDPSAIQPLGVGGEFSATTLPSGLTTGVDNPVASLQPAVVSSNSSTGVLLDQLIRSTNPNYALVNNQPLSNQFISPLNTFQGNALSRVPNDNVITTVPDLADINITSALSRIEDSTTFFDVLPTDNNPSGIISKDEVAAAIEYRNSFKSGSPLTAYTKFYQTVENNYFSKPADINSTGGFSNDTILFWVRKFFALPELTKFLNATYAFTNKLKSVSQLNQLHLNLILAKYQINTNSFFRCYSDSIGMLANSKYHQLNSTQPIFDITQQSYGTPIPFSANMENKIGPVARNLMFNLSKGCTALYRRNLMGIAYYNAVNVDNFEVSSQSAHSLNLVNDIAFFVQFHKKAEERMRRVQDSFPAFGGKLFQFVQYISNLGNRCALNLRDVYHPIATDRDFTATPGSTDLAVDNINNDIINSQINEYIQYENNDAATLQSLYGETADLQTSSYIIDRQLVARGSEYYIDQQVFPGYDANGNPVYYNIQGQEVQWQKIQGAGPYLGSVPGDPTAAGSAEITSSTRDRFVAVAGGRANLQVPGTYYETLPSGKTRQIIVGSDGVITVNGVITRNNDGSKITPIGDTYQPNTASGVPNDDPVIPGVTVTQQSGLRKGDVVLVRGVSVNGTTDWIPAMVNDVGGTTYGTGELGQNTLTLMSNQIKGMNIDPYYDFGGKTKIPADLSINIMPTGQSINTNNASLDAIRNSFQQVKSQLNIPESYTGPDYTATRTQSNTNNYTPIYQSAASPAPQNDTTTATADRPAPTTTAPTTAPAQNLPPPTVNGVPLSTTDVATAVSYAQNAGTRLFSNRQRVIPFTFQIRTEDIDGTSVYLNVDYLLKKVVIDNSDPNKTISVLEADKIQNSTAAIVPGSGQTVEQYKRKLRQITAKNKSLSPSGINSALQKAGVSQSNPVYSKLFNQLLRVYEQRVLTGNALTQATSTFINLASSRIPTNLLANITRSTGLYDNLVSRLNNVAGTSLIPGSNAIISSLNPFRYINIDLSDITPSAGLGSIRSIASVASQVATSGPPTSIDGVFDLLGQVKDLICNFELPFVNIDDIKAILTTKFKPSDILKAIGEEKRKILDRIGDFFKPENIVKNIWDPIKTQIENYFISIYRKVFVCDETAKQNKTGKPKALFGLPTPRQ